MITPVQSSISNYKNNKQQSFKGAIDALRFLNNSPAIGACAVDLGSMVIPRTVVDTKERGPQAGTETAIRESTSTINHATVGVVGLGAATLVSKAINNKYDIKANKLFVNSDAIDALGQYWKEANGDTGVFFKNVFSNMEGLNGSEWKALEESSDEIAKQFEKAGFNLTNELKQSIKSQIVHKTGAESTIKLGYKALDNASDAPVQKELVQTLDVFLETVNSLGKSFSSAGEKLGKTEFLTKHFDEFLGALKHNKLTATLLGLAVPVAVGVSTQPINRYLTKKRTGKDGFVGVDGREPDKSTGFKLKKAAIAGAMGTFALGTIGKNFKAILNGIQFSSMIPNLNQFKLIYGLTIVSRIMSARDGNELRESAIKDSLGFTNWLILGGMVSKLTAHALGKNGELINYDKAAHSGKTGIKKAWNWITKASVKTYDEVLLENADKIKDGTKTLRFKELYKQADPQVKKMVKKIAASQVAGYLYSGIVLGFGIAKLNIFITNKVNAKKQAKQENAEPKQDDTKVKYYAQDNESSKAVFSSLKKLS